MERKRFFDNRQTVHFWSGFRKKVDGKSIENHPKTNETAVTKHAKAMLETTASKTRKNVEKG